MTEDLVKQFRQNSLFRLIILVVLAFSVWWISIFTRGLSGGIENDLFTITYPIMSLVGGLMGWIFAIKWGGFKSVLGLSLLMFSFGLLAQFLGQALYNFYIYQLGINEPYPSIGDVSFLASVIFYIIGAYYLAKVSGIKLSVNSFQGRMKAFFIPAGILIISYWVLLKDYEIDLSEKVILFLDFGFPIGQAVFVSIALLALLISKDILGGMMRKPIMFLISALIFQYLADFAYSYQFSVNPDAMYVGDYLDYLYFLAYSFMTLALFSIGNMFYKVQES
jgi:hypothetical protein